MTDPMSTTPQAPPVCPRHPERVSYLRCQRCGRPTCPECQRPAPVGFHCVDCLNESARTAPTVRTSLGGAVTDGRPLTTYVLIGLCALAYVAQLAAPSFDEAFYFSPFMGSFEPWRFLTAAFLHSPDSPTHILFNMLALWSTGMMLEPMLGRARFLAVYLLSALGGSVGYLLLANPPQSLADLRGNDWTVGMTGASGAVFGLFGVILVLNRHFGRSASGMLVLLAINAVMPLLYPQIAWEAHLGGFVIGVIAALALIAARRRPPAVAWAWLGGLLVVIVAAAVVKYGASDTSFVDSYFARYRL